MHQPNAAELMFAVFTCCKFPWAASLPLFPQNDDPVTRLGSSTQIPLLEILQHQPSKVAGRLFELLYSLKVDIGPVTTKNAVCIWRSAITRRDFILMRLIARRCDSQAFSKPFASEPIPSQNTHQKLTFPERAIAEISLGQNQNVAGWVSVLVTIAERLLRYDDHLYLPHILEAINKTAVSECVPLKNHLAKIAARRLTFYQTAKDSLVDLFSERGLVSLIAGYVIDFEQESKHIA